QASMERFWTLRHLAQHGTTELTATLLRDLPGGAWLARADTLPLVFNVMGAQALTRGAHVRIKLGNIDPIALDVHGTVLEVLMPTAPTGTEEEAGEGDDDDTAAGPLAIAVDVDEADPPPAAP